MVHYDPRSMLAGQLEATQIVAEKPHVHLTENLEHKGQWNFHRLGGSHRTTSRPTVSHPTKAMLLPEILLTLKPALQFLQSVGGHNLETYYRAGPYLSLVMLMIVAFGVAFEFPILLVFLELAGVLPSARLRKWRRPAIVIIVAVAAVITPSQDPYSLFAMAVPMYIFYEGAILVGRLLKK